MTIALLLVVVFLAASNGANDNFKGVAALHGGGVAGYWTSLGWASVTTLAGSLCSVALAATLLHAFTGAGLVSAGIAAQIPFALSVAGGAALTVAASSRLGLPVSTTHALVGGMCGAGLLAAGMRIHLAALGATFLLPLLASPLLAIVPAWLLAVPLRHLANRVAVEPECVCAIDERVPVASGTLLLHRIPVVVAGSVADCKVLGLRPQRFRLGNRGLAEVLLFLSSGAASFARGLNDTPKIAALLLPVAMLDADTSVLTVGIAMLVGGLVGARRVARTMSERITKLDLATSLSASLTTGLLVSTASFNGLPVSTTHVSVGALVGAGANGASGIDRRTVWNIAWSWLVTLPAGAVFAALLFATLELIH